MALDYSDIGLGSNLLKSTASKIGVIDVENQIEDGSIQRVKLAQGSYSGVNNFANTLPSGTGINNYVDINGAIQYINLSRVANVTISFQTLVNMVNPAVMGYVHMVLNNKLVGSTGVIPILPGSGQIAMNLSYTVQLPSGKSTFKIVYSAGIGENANFQANQMSYVVLGT